MKQHHCPICKPISSGKLHLRHSIVIFTLSVNELPASTRIIRLQSICWSLKQMPTPISSGTIVLFFHIYQFLIDSRLCWCRRTNRKYFRRKSRFCFREGRNSGKLYKRRKGGGKRKGKKRGKSGGGEEVWELVNLYLKNRSINYRGSILNELMTEIQNGLFIIS